MQAFIFLNGVAQQLHHGSVTVIIKLHARLQTMTEMALQKQKIVMT